jgi:putative membrane protein
MGAHGPGETELARVSDAIRTAEAATSGEIFVVVARESDEYRAIPILWATLAALLLPLPLILFTLLPAGMIYVVQLAVFIVPALVLSLPRVKPWVVPPAVGHARARALAVQQFLAHGLHTTEARTGVLVFVSLAEHHAEIVADTGIAAKVGQATWDAAMAALIAEVREGRLAEGLIAAVQAVGAVLAEHFPPGALNRDELPDEVVVL